LHKQRHQKTGWAKSARQKDTMHDENARIEDYRSRHIAVASALQLSVHARPLGDLFLHTRSN
jgi:hypothetical protein